MIKELILGCLILVCLPVLAPIMLMCTVLGLIFG